MRRITRSVASAVLVLSLVSLGLTAPLKAASDIELVPVEIAASGVASVVPTDWTDIGGGLYARGDFPQEPTLIAIQSVRAPASQVWPGILPQLGLDEIPEPTGSLASEGFAWSLYRSPAPISVAGKSLDVELAVAEDDGATHLVLLQALPEEFAQLREDVFVPAVEAFAVLEPDATPDASAAGYRSEQVSFAGGADGVELAGTLTLPSTPGPHPAIVLMSGSGPQDRDESMQPMAAIKPFALIADALSSAGVAVLRYDDRGVGDSTGVYEGATITELAADGAAALDYLRGRTDIDARRIGLLGHSEGSLYAAMLAAEDPGVAFVVGLAAPAVDGVDLLVAQNEAITRASGGGEEEAAFAADYAARALPLARGGAADAVEALLREYVAGLWDRMPEVSRALVGDRDEFIEAQVDAQLPQLLSDWYRSILAYDPTPDWERVTVPVLAVYGGKDVQVIADQNEVALRAALETAGNEDVEIVTLPDANHLFQASETGALQEYGRLPGEFTPDLLPTLVTWLTEHTGLAEPS